MLFSCLFDLLRFSFNFFVPGLYRFFTSIDRQDYYIITYCVFV